MVDPVGKTTKWVTCRRAGTFFVSNVSKHEITYNWYKPGAGLGRNLDENHEETKGAKGWTVPTRCSVTWLVYLNEQWYAVDDGGALRGFTRTRRAMAPMCSHEGNLQVVWLNHVEPVFLECLSTDDRRSQLYILSSGKHDDKSSPPRERIMLTERNFDVPAQPVRFADFLPPRYRNEFEQISTSRLDPRFAEPTKVSAEQEK